MKSSGERSVPAGLKRANFCVAAVGCALLVAAAMPAAQGRAPSSPSLWLPACRRAQRQNSCVGQQAAAMSNPERRVPRANVQFWRAGLEVSFSPDR